jgi:hypothetical protein
MGMKPRKLFGVTSGYGIYNAGAPLTLIITHNQSASGSSISLLEGQMREQGT